jgi:hypothetical protein
MVEEEGSQNKKDIKSMTDEELEALFDKEVRYFVKNFELIYLDRLSDIKGNHLTAYSEYQGFTAFYEALVTMAEMIKNNLLHNAKTPLDEIEALESFGKERGLEFFKNQNINGLIDYNEDVEQITKVLTENFESYLRERELFGGKEEDEALKTFKDSMLENIVRNKIEVTRRNLKEELGKEDNKEEEEEKEE